MLLTAFIETSFPDCVDLGEAVLNLSYLGLDSLIGNLASHDVGVEELTLGGLRLVDVCGVELLYEQHLFVCQFGRQRKGGQLWVFDCRRARVAKVSRTQTLSIGRQQDRFEARFVP